MLRELVPHSDQKRDKASFLLEVRTFYLLSSLSRLWLLGDSPRLVSSYQKMDRAEFLLEVRALYFKVGGAGFRVKTSGVRARDWFPLTLNGMCVQENFCNIPFHTFCFR